MSGKVTLFISGISGSKEVFFVKFNDFFQIALGVELNNVLIFKQSSVTRGVSDPWSCIGVVRYWTASGISPASYTVSLMIKLLNLSNNS